MALVGPRREMAEAGRLLDSAAGGWGGILVVTGPPGSGRTKLVAAAPREGAVCGFEMLRTATIRGQPGQLVWAQLLRDAGAPDDLAAGYSIGPGRWILIMLRALTAAMRPRRRWTACSRPRVEKAVAHRRCLKEPEPEPSAEPAAAVSVTCAAGITADRQSRTGSQ